MYDVLVCLLHLFSSGDKTEFSIVDPDAKEELPAEAMPFGQDDIISAFRWIQEFLRLKGFFGDSRHFDSKVRVFSPEEINALTTEARGALLEWHRQRLIDCVQREIIIERAMAMNSGVIDKEQLEWVTHVVIRYDQDKHLHAWLSEQLHGFRSVGSSQSLN